MKRVVNLLALLGAISLAGACAHHPVGEVLPTRFVTDRIFGVPRTIAGDTLTLLLDTGDSGRIFADAVARLGLVVDSIKTARGGYRRVTSLPRFRAGQALPDAVTPSPYGARVILTPPTDAFDTLMSSHTAGQLGHLWFADRVWTFDYRHHRLVLHPEMPAAGPASHRIPLEFRGDSTGQRYNNTPRISVVVDTDSLLLLFDTGATMWLTDQARKTLGDGGPSERAWSLVRLSLFTRWRARHPDWRVIERANQLGNVDIIEVPRVRIAGFDVGPVWFGTLDDSRWPTDPPRRLRIDGTLGGSALKYFIVTLDYPNALAQFTPIGAR